MAPVEIYLNGKLNHIVTAGKQSHFEGAPLRGQRPMHIWGKDSGGEFCLTEKGCGKRKHISPGKTVSVDSITEIVGR